MADQQLTKMLAAGWTVRGYSTTIMAAGAMTHSILLQRKETELAQVTIVLSGSKELGRTFSYFSPTDFSEPPIMRDRG